MKEGTDPRVLARLRERIGVSPEEVSDEALLEGTEGSFTRAKIDLSIAMDDLRAAIREAVRQDWQRIKLMPWKLTGGRPMMLEHDGYMTIGTVWRDRLGRLWLARGPWAIERIAIIERGAE